MHQRAPGTLTLWLGAPAPKRLHHALHTFRGVVHQRLLEIPVWCPPRVGTSPKQGKSIDHHPKATTVHPGHWQIEVADEDIHGHAHQLHDKPERQQTPRTNPRLANTSCSRASCAVVAKEVEWTATPAVARGREQRKPEATEEEDTKHFRSENEEVGQRIRACSVGREARPHDNLLETNLHRLSGKEMPPMTWKAGVTLVQMWRALSKQQRRPVRTKPASMSKSRLWATPTR